jgi:hypothetical protein
LDRTLKLNALWMNCRRVMPLTLSALIPAITGNHC